MRGRTNITQRAIPYVAGEVITAEVETGSVGVGDWVEYKTVTGITVIGTDSYQVVKELTKGNYKVVLTTKINEDICSLNLYSLSNGQLLNSVVFSYNFNGVYRADFDFISDNEIVLLINNAVASTGQVIYLKIENDLLVSKNTYSLSTVSNQYWVNICSIGNGNFIVISRYVSSSYAGSVQAILYINNGVITLRSKKEGTTLVTNDTNFQYSRALFVESGKLAILVLSGPISTNANLKLYLKLFSFDGSYNFTSIQNTNTTLVSAAFSYQVLNIDNKNVAIVCNTNITSGQTNWVSKLFVVSYNNNLISLVKTIDLKNILYTTGLDTGFSNFTTLSLLTNNIFGVISYGKLNESSETGFILITFNFNEVNYDCEVVDKIYISSVRLQQNLLFIKFGNEVKLYYSSTNEFYNYIRRFIWNGSLQSYVDKNYVKQYSGNNAIGFAKTGGTAGQNVKIYIPSTS